MYTGSKEYLQIHSISTELYVCVSKYLHMCAESAITKKYDFLNQQGE